MNDKNFINQTSIRKPLIYSGIGIFILFGLIISASGGLTAIFASIYNNIIEPELNLWIEKQEKLEITVNGMTGPITAGVSDLLWDWGDGTKERGFFPRTHQYSQAGSYKVKVVAAGIFSQTTEELPVMFNSLPPNLSVYQESVSVNGLEVSVNGFVENADYLDWDWGDKNYAADKNWSWFPARHIYKDYGTYTVTATAWKNGLSTVKKIEVAIPPEKTPILETFIKSTDGLSVTIDGFVENAEYLIWIWSDKADSEERTWFPARHVFSQEGEHRVDVKAINGRNTASKTFFVTVPEKLVTVKRVYSGFYNFPKRFFDQTKLSQYEILAALDAQYLSLKKMHNGAAPYQYTKIEYRPEAYGATTPTGITIGDTAFPYLNNSQPRWEVMAHEQGHNFFGGTSSFYYQLASPYPFLQESFAVLSAFYTYNDIIKNQRVYKLPGNIIGSLYYDFSKGINYQRDRMQDYITNGKKFDVGDVLTSQALDYMMINYGNSYGWEKYQKFSKAFENGIASKFNFQNDGVSATEQSTYVIAALNAAFGQDFRIAFAGLNFPMDESLYNEIYPKINEYINDTANKEKMESGIRPSRGFFGRIRSFFSGFFK